MPLLRILGVWFSLAVVVGGAIGASIMRSPGLVAGYAGNQTITILVWAAACVFALMGAASLTELAAAIPQSGGFYVFARRALGDGFGAVIGGADWLANCSGLAWVALAASEFAGRLVPRLSGHENILAAVSLVVIAAAFARGIRVSSRLQEAASAIKALAFLWLVAALLLSPAAVGEPAAPAAPFPSLVSLALAFQLALGACDGWQNGAYFAGEDVDPGRNLPRGMVGGVAIVSVVYLLLVVAIGRVLPFGLLATSGLPAADAAATVFGEPGRTAVTVLSIWSPLTGLSVTLLTAPRILYAMGANGLAPASLSIVDQRGTPRIAMACSLAAALLFLPIGGFEAVATIFAIFAITSYLGGFISVLVLRRTEPELPRPFTVWGAPWTVLVVIAGNLAILCGIAVSAPRDSAIALIALAAGYAVYSISRRR